MYARSTTIQASPTSLDQGVTYLREKIMPVLLDLPGCIGLSALVDRESGRCIASTSWATESAMRATIGTVKPLRDKGVEKFAGSIERVEEWEVALLHREHNTREGTCVRVTRITVDPAKADLTIGTLRSSVLPQVEALEGFCSLSLFVDRTAGRFVGAFAFDSRSALEASREAATKIRTATTKQLGASVEEVREFELAIAHLRVPELV